MYTVQITGLLFKWKISFSLCSLVSVFVLLPHQKIILKATSMRLAKEGCQVKRSSAEMKYL